MSNFETTTVLPSTDCTEEDFYNLVRNLKPLADLLSTGGGLQLIADKLALAASVPRWVKYTKTFADLTAASLTNEIELFQLPAGGVIHAVKIKSTTPFTGGSISAYTVEVGINGNTDKYAAAFDVWPAVQGYIYRLVQAPFNDDLTLAAFGNTDGEIAGLTISGSYDQAEIEALRAKCEELADDARAMRAVLNAFWTGQRLGGENHDVATSIRLTARSTGANLSEATAGSVNVWVLQSVARD